MRFKKLMLILNMDSRLRIGLFMMKANIQMVLVLGLLS